MRRPLAVYAAVFLTVLIGLALASEAMLHGQVLPQDDFVEHIRLFEETPARDAAFGDSHVARDFVPDAAMVNLAYPSEGIAHIDWKIRTFFAHRTPGRVVLQADPHLFAPYRLDRPFGNYPESFDADVASAVPLILDPRFRPGLQAFWSSYLTSGGALKSRIVRTENGALLSPGNLSDKSTRARALEARIRMQWHSERGGARAIGARKTYSELLDFLAFRGARICLVSFPVSAEYRSAFAKEANPSALRQRAATLSYFAEEARRVGAVYVDDRAAFDTNEAFRDVDHLNRNSAQAYSSHLLHACFDSGETIR